MDPQTDTLTGLDVPEVQPGTTAKKKRPRRLTGYELPTPEKRAFGQRLREAREVAGMDQKEASQALGYAQQVQLSIWEKGARFPPHEVIGKLATMYGTTTDWFYGLAPDSDRDPAVAVQRHVAALVAAELQRLIDHMAKLSADSVRELMPSLGDGQRMAQVALELVAALRRFHELNPKFTDMRGGATVLSKIETLSELARVYSAHVERGRRLMTTRAMRQSDRDAAAVEQFSMLPALDLTLSAT